jgi:hypothetical protein
VLQCLQLQLLLLLLLLCLLALAEQLAVNLRCRMLPLQAVAT